MALMIKNLGEGQLGTTAQGTLYSVMGGKAAIVKSIRVVNRDTVSRTLNLHYLRLNGTGSRLISPSALSLPPGGAYIDDTEVSLAASDQIQGDASVASKLDYVIGVKGAVRQSTIWLDELIELCCTWNHGTPLAN